MRRADARGRSGRRGASSRRSGGFVSVGLVLTVTVGLIGTVLGVGATSHTLNIADGNVWLWSSKPGRVGRVNTNSGRVDANQPLLDARGHRVQVTQNDRYLLLHDLDAGKVTSVDLTRMGFTGSMSVARGADVRVVLSGDRGVLIDRRSGKIRGFDPANLRTTGAHLRLPAPLAGGDFDADGQLWVGVPSLGTVVSVAVDRNSARPRRTEAVATAGHTMALTVLDHGVLAADTDGHRISVVGTKVTTYSASEPLTGALLPSRTVGTLAAVTLPGSGQVLPVPLTSDRHRVVPFALPNGVTPGAATPFAGRLYVPDDRRHAVYVFSASGRRVGRLGLSGATGRLRLQVREQHLMINAPDSSVARVVDTDGVTRVVDKYRADDPGGDGDLSMIAAPAPGDGDQDADRGRDGHGGRHGTPDDHGDDAVHGPPGPPIPVTASPADGRVDLSWPQPATNGAPIRHYDVRWDGGHRRVDGDTRSLRVTGLTNGTTYSFVVTATNRYGTGPQALSDRVTPDRDAPPGAPEGLTVSATGANQATVTWRAAPGNGHPVTGYTVSYNGESHTTTTLRYVVDGLPNGTQLTVRVHATNAVGDGADATASGVAGVPPTVRVQKVTSKRTSVTATFNADNGTGGGKAEVTCSALLQGPGAPGARTPGTCLGDGRTVTFSVPHLEYGVRYTVRVTVGNKTGNSAASGNTTTPGKSGTVSCTNGPGAPKTGDGAVDCSDGVGMYPQPKQVDGTGRLVDGTRGALCKKQGQHISSGAYNDQKESTWWIMLQPGMYIPYAWYNLSGGDNTLNALNTCP